VALSLPIEGGARAGGGGAGDDGGGLSGLG
jgi:hypothetical protein